MSEAAKLSIVTDVARRVRDVFVRERRPQSWSTFRRTVYDTAAVPVFGDDPFRDSATLSNRGPNGVYVGPQRSNETLRRDGFLVASGGSYSHNATGALYAVCDVGETATLHCAAEYHRDVNDDA